MPRQLRQHIDLIKPTVHFNHRPAPNALLKRTGGLGQPFSGSGPKKSNKPVKITPSLANCDQIITLDCLRALYKINYIPCSTHKNTFGIGSLGCVDLVLQIFTTLLDSWIYASSIFSSRSWSVFQVYVKSACLSYVCQAVPFRNFSPSQVGMRPQAVLIDGGSWSYLIEY